MNCDVSTNKKRATLLDILQAKERDPFYRETQSLVFFLKKYVQFFTMSYSSSALSPVCVCTIGRWPTLGGMKYGRSLTTHPTSTFYEKISI